MGLQFTNLHIFKTDRTIPVDPDLQITEMVKRLEGAIKSNWQVLAPTPDTRVLYFEMEDAREKPRLVEGYGEELREMQLGVQLKKRRGTRRRKKEDDNG